MEKAKITFAICYLLLILIIFFVSIADYFRKKEIKELKNKPPETIIVEHNVSPIPYDDLGLYTISHYCDCPICTGTAKGSRTASGVKPKDGRTIACDGKILKMGDVVYIETIGLRVCEDRGGAIKDNRIDLFISDHEKAKKLGIKKVKVYKLL